MPNHLINESSPYLLQHAHQPVDWYPYSEQVFELAKNQDKPLIISIGYSTCHWCHVMAHECFDDVEVAELMNKYFISVKVDREELPDVDKYYMNGLQILTGRGGWPLNVFVLPDKRMFYGVTYLPKHAWMDLLKKIIHLYNNEKSKLYEYADSIHNGVKQFELSGIQHAKGLHGLDKLQTKVNEWKTLFDKEWGGHQYVPKFVMPVNYMFLMKYATLTNDKEVWQHIHNSIRYIALGGLFDHVGGGFYRYSTDRYWKIPHFEKMLYDNAQMIEWLTYYYLLHPSDEIKWILEKNIECVLRDFYSNEHLFYSAWDADSEGEEGEFYVWTLQELKNILKNDFDEFAEIFNLSNHFGYWENEKYVLTINIPLFDEKTSYWIEKINQWTKVLFEERKKRVHPSVDTKIITSWNALMIKALATAGFVLNTKRYVDIAEQSLQQLLNKVWINENLYRIYDGKQSKILAYLDDYAFLIDAIITLEKFTGNADYLSMAEQLTEITINEFYSASDNLFYYTSAKHSINQSVELFDDVIPSANAQMIKNLFYLSPALNNHLFENIAKKIFDTTASLFYAQPLHTASYGNLILQQLFFDEMEICIAGKNTLDYLHKIFPQVWHIHNIYTTSKESTLSIFQNRFHSQKSFIYVCQHKTCYAPLENTDDFNISAYL